MCSSINENVRKESCLIISNITAGTLQQIHQLLEMGIATTLVEVLKSADYRTKREACWAIANALIRNQLEIARKFVENDCVRVLLEFVISIYQTDDRIAVKSLEALMNILISGELKESSGVDNILMQQFESLNIDKDEGYGSSTSLLKNQFINRFLEPLDYKSGKEIFREIAKCESRAGLVAQEIISTWFQ